MSIKLEDLEIRSVGCPRFHLEPHLSDEQIDSFALGRMSGRAATHLLVCHECFDQLEQTIEFIEFLRSELMEIKSAAPNQ
jgi:hypothetical protein